MGIIIMDMTDRWAEKKKRGESKIIGGHPLHPRGAAPVCKYVQV